MRPCINVTRALFEPWRRHQWRTTVGMGRSRPLDSTVSSIAALRSASASVCSPCASSLSSSAASVDDNKSCACQPLPSWPSCASNGAPRRPRRILPPNRPPSKCLRLLPPRAAFIAGGRTVEGLSSEGLYTAYGDTLVRVPSDVESRICLAALASAGRKKLLPVLPLTRLAPGRPLLLLPLRPRAMLSLKCVLHVCVRIGKRPD